MTLRQLALHVASNLLRRRSELARAGIGRDGSRAAHSLRPSHVAVGSHEVDGITLHAGAPHLRTPWNDVHFEFSPVTHRPDLGRSVPRHMDLPVQRSKRCEVILVAIQVCFHQWQAVTALNRLCPL
jgi:hypothetical protein